MKHARTTRGLVKQITGKSLVEMRLPNWYYLHLEHMEVPGGRGKKEQAVHEVCHWVVAEDWQRTHPENLGYGHSSDDFDGRDPRCTTRMQKRQELLTCYLQRELYRRAGIHPKSAAYTPAFVAARITKAELEHLERRATEVGWDLLVILASARW